MLLQIGTKGVMDSADGTATGRGLNASHTSLFKPTQVTVDPGNGDIYVRTGTNALSSSIAKGITCASGGIRARRQRRTPVLAVYS